MHGVLAYSEFAPVLILLLIVIAMAGGMIAASALLGPKRRGPRKDETYESGMPPIGDARQRFNVRFYLVAMLFLLFDVEVVFMWPWALLFRDTAAGAPSPYANGLIAAGHDKDFFAAVMGVFMLLLLVGFVYEWGKGAFKWR